MEEGDGARNSVEQPQTIQNVHIVTTQEGQSTHPSGSQRTTAEHPAVDSPLLPQVPVGENLTGERAQCSARGEPAIHLPPPIQDSTLATCQHIVGLLGQITDQQDGIMRELRVMRREMRLLKGEQRRTTARVVSVAHAFEAFKEQFQWQQG
ncbi:Hypothetical predicted protein [Podarcis lilfordi]|uniref:Uncharacterized protein n=1 Tax=Podarcis lilfordi TaxID=74358 RepID=A0AA35JSU1_9SAUR|nr:Hypothetical predicted protein [Podarcis lilfordi]